MAMAGLLGAALVAGVSYGQCAGDVNSDGVVDGTDLSILLSNWGPSAAGTPWGDLNGDGAIDAMDMNIVLSDWRCTHTPEIFLQVSPYAVATGAPSQITFTFELPPALAAQLAALEIVPVDSSGLVIGPAVAVARDHGADGDVTGGDAVYTGRMTRTYAVPAIERFAVRVPMSTGTRLSNHAELVAAVPVTAAQLAEQTAILDASAAAWTEKLSQLGRTHEARAAAVEAIRTIAGVASVSLSPIDQTTISVTGPSGLVSLILTYEDDPPQAAVRASRVPPAKRVELAASGLAAPNPTRRSLPAAEKIRNQSILYWAPTGNSTPISIVEQGAGCFKIDSYIGPAADMNALWGSGLYGAIFIKGHGGWNPSGYSFATGVEWYSWDMQSYADIYRDELLTQDLQLVWHENQRFIGITYEGVLRRALGRYDGALVYLGSCESSALPMVPQAFRQNGAAAVIGWSDSVSMRVNQDRLNAILAGLVRGDALNEILPAPSIVHCWLTQTSEMCASLRTIPAPVPSLGYDLNPDDGTALESPGFETEGRNSWKKVGAVQFPSAMGSYHDWLLGTTPLVPTEGSRMLLLQLGHGGGNPTECSVAQTFRIPAPGQGGFGLVAIGFKWTALRNIFIGFPPPDTTFLRASLMLGDETVELMHQPLSELSFNTWATASAGNWALFAADGDGAIPENGIWRIGGGGLYPFGRDHAGECATLRFELGRSGESLWADLVLIDDITLSVY